MAEIARELENKCGSIPKSTLACSSVVPVCVGKGRLCFGECEFDEGASVACIASVGRALLDPGDGLSADWLVKGRIAPVDS